MDEENEPQLRKYTLNEANALVAEARPVLQQLRDIWQAADSERGEFERIQRSDAGPIEVSLSHQQLVSALWGVQPLISWLRGHDIVLRDPAAGLIDFFSEIAGEDGYLCWRLGEHEIRYWHGTDEGFSDRKPLPGIQ